MDETVHTHLHTIIRVYVHPENLDETHMDHERTRETPHRQYPELRIKQRTLDL